MSRSPYTYFAYVLASSPSPAAESGTKGGGCVNNAANVINMEQASNELSDDTVLFLQKWKLFDFYSYSKLSSAELITQLAWIIFAENYICVAFLILVNQKQKETHFFKQNV